MVFDNSFATTKCLDTDQIATNWPELFKNCEVNLLDPDQEAHYKLDSSWHEPEPEHPIARSRSPSVVRFVDELDLRDNNLSTKNSTVSTSPDIGNDSTTATTSSPVDSPDISEETPALNPPLCLCK